MDKTRVLVVGGYGTVGTVLSEVLAHDPRVALVIGGRDARKAGDLARSLHAEARTIDVLDEATIPAALEGVRVVVNCFSGPFTGAPLRIHLPSLRCASTAGLGRRRLQTPEGGQPCVHPNVPCPSPSP